MPLDCADPGQLISIASMCAVAVPVPARPRHSNSRAKIRDGMAPVANFRTWGSVRAAGAAGCAGDDAAELETACAAPAASLPCLRLRATASFGIIFFREGDYPWMTVRLKIFL
jgi:hypothetical protein